MKREDVIRMAREAGAAVGKVAPDSEYETIWPQCMDVERFASLVAAAERERCAKKAENITMFIQYQEKEDYRCASVIAAAIRALP